MNVAMIEDEVYAFTQRFFSDISQKLEDALSIIEENSLAQPREDYTILKEYINSIFNHFSNLDYQIVDPLMIKVHRDVITLTNLYKEYTKKCSSLDDIFNKELASYSSILSSLNKDSINYSISKNLPKQEREENLLKLSSLKKFKEIYFEIFEQIFAEEKKYFLSLILQILNSKIYYLDLMIWKKAPLSKSIMSSLGLTQKQFNSKEYIKTRLSIILPYSQEHQYLTKCLKVFK